MPFWKNWLNPPQKEENHVLENAQLEDNDDDAVEDSWDMLTQDEELFDSKLWFYENNGRRKWKELSVECILNIMEFLLFEDEGWKESSNDSVVQCEERVCMNDERRLYGKKDGQLVFMLVTMSVNEWSDRRILLHVLRHAKCVVLKDAISSAFVLKSANRFDLNHIQNSHMDMRLDYVTINELIDMEGNCLPAMVFVMRTCRSLHLILESGHENSRVVRFLEMLQYSVVKSLQLTIEARSFAIDMSRAISNINHLEQLSVQIHNEEIHIDANDLQVMLDANKLTHFSVSGVSDTHLLSFVQCTKLKHLLIDSNVVMMSASLCCPNLANIGGYSKKTHGDFVSLLSEAYCGITDITQNKEDEALSNEQFNELVMSKSLQSITVRVQLTMFDKAFESLSQPNLAIRRLDLDFVRTGHVDFQRLFELFPNIETVIVRNARVVSNLKILSSNRYNLCSLQFYDCEFGSSLLIPFLERNEKCTDFLLKTDRELSQQFIIRLLKRKLIMRTVITGQCVSLMAPHFKSLLTTVLPHLIICEEVSTLESAQ